MSIQLNEEQGQALDNQTDIPPRVVDPRTNKTYVLIETGEYERLKMSSENDFSVRDVYPLIDAVADNEGWNDPEMDIYNDYDFRKKA
jgi:hypothetical protein